MLKQIVKIWLWWLAARVLRKYQPKIIAITGSTGKTSAKDATALVLTQNLTKRGIQVGSTPGNLNTEFGVAATIVDPTFAGTTVNDKTKLTIRDISRLTKAAIKKLVNRANYPKILVLELAADRPGDIAYFMRRLKPEIGVLTNIGDVHLEFFGSKSELADEKGKLIAGVNPNGLAILNRDDELTNLIAQKTTARKIFIGLHEGADAVAANIALSSSGLHFDVNYRSKTAQINMPVYGEQFVYSALVAVIIGDYLGVDLIDSAAALSQYSPAAGRFERVELKGLTLIDDTYNANPTSMVAALTSLGRLAGPRRKVAILGDMRELGTAHEKGHREVGTVAASVLDLLITVGDGGRLIGEAATAAGLSADRVIGIGELDEIFAHLRDNDVVLVKGSRAVHLDRIATLIKEKYTPAQPARENSEQRIDLNL
ncbi:hypothetical protein A2810_00695 [candidate division Kazan bacterium RIFCSPHIGHO2_01_FULL_49_10]|nr:MAG: hypothetical protein A2810_00695 [candidate division Kazan bacterium RIFCSPHIGHO2_01_FULL_49_10]